MPLRLSLEELVLAGVPCSSSSFLSISTRGSGTDGTNAGTSDWTQGGAEVPAFNRKRKGKSPEVIGELKQAKLVNDSWLLVGRLLLWNRTASSHPGTGSNSLDCLAFCDGATAVCCTVQSLDVELLGQYVQVNSWRFVPTIKHADKIRDANGGATSSEAFPRPERGGAHESGNARVLSESLDCGGWLEIHSLELLDQPSQTTAQVFDFPSLCLSPVGANAPNLALETPEKKKGQRKPRLWTWGLLHCMSLPFLLPSNSSFQNAPEGRSLSKQSTQNSLNIQSDSKSLLGLLVELRICGSIWQPKHQQNAIDAWTCRYSEFLEQEAVDAGNHGTVAIYFSGAVASWRPLLGEMLGVYVAVTGLRRKMIQLGPEREEVLIYVATRKTLVFRINPTWVDSSILKLGDAVGLCEHKSSNRRQEQPNDDLPRFEKVVPNGEASFIFGRGLGSYVGKITSVLMQGAILEVDDKVWLLLTHYKHTQVHGLRVGALVAVRHAHIMSLRSVSEKVLVLGACVRSHVVVVHHSISSAGSLNSQVSQSRLTKYVGSLPFAWAFWVLHVIASLKLKLRGVYSDTELLGSMKVCVEDLCRAYKNWKRLVVNHSGLIRKVLPSMVAAPVTLHRDAFKEFLLHEQFCRLGDTSATVILSKIPALSNFCKLVEMLWADPVSSIWHDDHRRNDENCNFGPQIARLSNPTVPGNSCYIRNIIPGVELDVVLVGSLKVCKATGKLQLVDATGALDVVVPDLQSFSNLHSVYQISEYKLVMEGDYTSLAESAVGVSSNIPAPISWSSLLKGSVIGTSEPSSASYYAKFDLRYAKRLEGLSWPSHFQGHKSGVAVEVHKSRDVKNESTYVWKGKEFHIALITHKYPAREKFSLDKEMHWAFDVEVVLLPYRLLIHQDHDASNDILNPISENLDSSSCKVQRATKTSRMEELGGMRERVEGAMEAPSGCLIECSVCCLVEQSSGLRKSAVQSSRTFLASLLTRGCSPSTPIPGKFCGSKEHWAAISEAKLQKVLLAVNWRAIEMSQMFNTGDWCLLPTSQDILSSGMSLECRRVEIDAEQPLISLQWGCAGDGQSIESDAVELLQTAASNGGATSTFVLPSEPDLDVIDATDFAPESEGDSSALNLGRCPDDDTENMSGNTRSSQTQLVDVVLIVSDSFRHELRSWLVSLKRKLIPELLNVIEALQLSSHTATMLPKYGSSHEERSDIFGAVKLEASSGILSLQGEVVSIQGKLEMTECPGHPSSAGNDDLSGFSFSKSSASSRWRKSLVQLRDLRTDHLIRIDINFDKYITPAGFGPGAVACFRRVLLRRGENVLVRMPTTDVAIVSVEKRSRDFSYESQRPSTTSLSSQEHEECPENVTCVDLLKDFISELEPRKKFLKVHCRVVSVQGLELEWQISPPLSVGNLPAEDLVRDIAVKWGYFIIDDGSAVAECWASGDQAANLLGFRELARNIPPFCPSIYALASKIPFFKDQQSSQRASLMQVLRFLVRKHKRVSVQGEPPQGDTGTTSWLMKGIDSDLAESEATLLKLILEQACQLGPKVVHCTPMSDNDSNFRSAEGQACFPTMSNVKPWQNLTWSRTQLVTTKVDVVNVWVGFQQLASSFDI